MKLLDLPNELLSTIILETMWATTIEPSDAPDLLMHERRLTNHPSIEHKKVAFVGQICGKLRRIAQPHSKPVQLWHDAGARVQTKLGCPVVKDAPASFMAPSVRAIACSRGQAVFLPQSPSATLEHLSELSISGRHGGGVLVGYSDQVLSSIGRCKQLQHLTINTVVGSASGTTGVFDDIASIPTLQTLTIDDVYVAGYPAPPQPFSVALGQTWHAPLVRLEVIWCGGVTFRCFLELMGKVAATIQVAIFHHDDHQTLSTLESSSAAVASFPQLWRLDIGFGLGAHPEYRCSHAVQSNTRAGRLQLAECSPVAIWKAAPRLEYFECSEQIVVKTQKELEEISGLRKREGMKRLRLKLETWEGDKGAGWSTDKIQELVV